MSDALSFDAVSTPEQFNAFRTIVLNHLTQQVSEDLWEYFRYRALNKLQWVIDDLTWQEVEDLDRIGLVQKFVSESNQPAKEMLEINRGWITVGEIDGSPVWFSSRLGLYFWGNGADAEHILELWLTFPAYPPGW